MARTLSAIEVRGLGETQTLEFKRALGHRNDGLQALCGMVNANGATGTVVFGVDPSGAIVGVEDGNLDTAQRSLAQHIADKFEPALMVQIEVVECEGNSLIVLHAQRAKTVPTTSTTAGL